LRTGRDVLSQSALLRYFAHKWLARQRVQNIKQTNVIKIEQTRNSDASNVALGSRKYRNPGNGGSLMQPVGIESPIGLDRLATWNEVRCALSFSLQGAFVLVGACDDFREMDSDFNGRACNLPGDTMWLAIISEMPDSTSN
jgi:hypothetical protein